MDTSKLCILEVPNELYSDIIELFGPTRWSCIHSITQRKISIVRSTQKRTDDVKRLLLQIGPFPFALEFVRMFVQELLLTEETRDER